MPIPHQIIKKKKNKIITIKKKNISHTKTIVIICANDY
jgi:hypothetical protein